MPQHEAHVILPSSFADLPLSSIDAGPCGGCVFWFDKHTRLICAAVVVSAVVNLALCTATAFVGIGWDWDVLLVCLLLQCCNGAVAVCLFFRRQLLRGERAGRNVLALVLAAAALRVAALAMLLEIALAPPNSNDGECKVLGAGDACAEWWYIRTPQTQSFARYALATMAIDTALTVGSTLNLRAILRLEQHAARWTRSPTPTATVTTAGSRGGAARAALHVAAAGRAPPCVSSRSGERGSVQPAQGDPAMARGAHQRGLAGRRGAQRHRQNLHRRQQELGVLPQHQPVL